MRYPGIEYQTVHPGHPENTINYQKHTVGHPVHLIAMGLNKKKEEQKILKSQTR